MRTSHNKLRILILQEMKKRNLSFLFEQLGDPGTVDLKNYEAEALDHAMSIAERESIDLYGDVDIDRLASEKGFESVVPTAGDRGMSPGEAYIDYLKNGILDKLV